MEYQDPQKNNLTDMGKKSAYEIVRNKWVSKIANAFKPVEIDSADI
jgi:hypothetical protein